MNIEYDPQADALYLSIQPDTLVEKSKELEQGLVVDWDKNKKVVGLEILDVSKKFKLDNLLNFSVKGIEKLQSV